MGPFCRAQNCSLTGKCNSLLPRVSSRWKGQGEYQAQKCSQPHSTFLLFQFPCCWLCSDPSWIFPCDPNPAWEWLQRNPPKPEGTLELTTMGKDVLGGKFPAQTLSTRWFLLGWLWGNSSFQGRTPNGMPTRYLYPFIFQSRATSQPPQAHWKQDFRLFSQSAGITHSRKYIFKHSCIFLSCDISF